MRKEIEEQFQEQVDSKVDTATIMPILPTKANNKHVAHEIAEVKSKLNIMESYIQSIIKGNKTAFERDLAEKADVDFVK